MAMNAGAMVVIGALAVFYWCTNRRRDRLFGTPPQEDDASSEASVRSDMWANLTDKERKSFRYGL